MSSPTAGAVGPDGTLYLAERAGTVHPLTDDGLGSRGGRPLGRDHHRR
jgi:hypothetical protein